MACAHFMERVHTMPTFVMDDVRFASAAAVGVAVASALLLFSSPATAHAIAGDRVFPSTMAVDDPGVGDEANLIYGHQRVAGDSGDQSINTFSFEYDKLITSRLALSVDGAYVMQNNPAARGFDNFGIGLKTCFMSMLHTNS